jgi:hypothetical protein
VNPRRPVLVVCLAVLGVVGLGGCRAAVRVALPAPAPRSAPAAGDPLDGIESSVAAVERDVDVDSRADVGADPAAGR